MYDVKAGGNRFFASSAFFASTPALYLNRYTFVVGVEYMDWDKLVNIIIFQLEALDVNVKASQKVAACVCVSQH